MEAKSVEEAESATDGSICGSRPGPLNRILTESPLRLVSTSLKDRLHDCSRVFTQQQTNNSEVKVRDTDRLVRSIPTTMLLG